MRLELKGFVHHASLSEETEAFTAKLYIDGKMTAIVENHGQGGNTNVHPEAIGIRDVMQAELRIRQAEAYCATLPPLDLGHGLKPLTMTVEHWVDGEVDRIIMEKLVAKEVKRLKKMMTDKVLLIRPEHKPGEFSIYKVKPERIPGMKAVHKGCRILNEFTDADLDGYVRQVIESLKGSS